MIAEVYDAEGALIRREPIDELHERWSVARPNPHRFPVVDGEAVTMHSYEIDIYERDGGPVFRPLILGGRGEDVVTYRYARTEKRA